MIAENSTFHHKPMEIFDSIGGFISGINFTLIFQLTCLALIVVSGPIVIFLLSARGGDL
jgi:hypothetical protein